MSKDLSELDACFNFKVAIFFYVEYAKRHAEMCLKEDYLDLLNNFEYLKNKFYIKVFFHP